MPRILGNTGMTPRLPPPFPMFLVPFPLKGLKRGSRESLKVLKERIWGVPNPWDSFPHLKSQGTLWWHSPLPMFYAPFPLKVLGRGMWALPVGVSPPLTPPKKKRMWEIPFPLPGTGKGGILGFSMSLWSFSFPRI